MARKVKPDSAIRKWIDKKFGKDNYFNGQLLIDFASVVLDELEKKMQDTDILIDEFPEKEHPGLVISKSDFNQFRKKWTTE